MWSAHLILPKPNLVSLENFLAVMEKWKRPPEEEALEHIVARRDKPFLEERYIDSFKGRWFVSWISLY